MATTYSKKTIGKKPKSSGVDAVIEEAPIQFGVPSERAAAVDPMLAASAAQAVGIATIELTGELTADVTGDAIDLPELADALDMAAEPVVEPVVEIVAARSSDFASELSPELASAAATIAPVELDIAPIDLSRVALPAAPPVSTPEPSAESNPTNEPKKDLPMDETTSTTNPAGMMNGAMNGAAETMKTAASDMQARGAAMMGDMNGRAKSAMERGSKAVEELVEFQKGNLEAMMTSGRVASNGAQEIAKYSAEYGRSTIEKANANARQFATVKSPTEFFQLQGEIAKQTLDAMVAEGAKFTESYMKLMGEVTQPLSNRVAVAVDTAKTTMGSVGGNQG